MSCVVRGGMRQTKDNDSQTYSPWQDRLRQCAEELQGALLDLRARDSELDGVKEEVSALSGRMDAIQESARRARSEAAEWKALAERYILCHCGCRIYIFSLLYANVHVHSNGSTRILVGGGGRPTT